jgi:hypothetical protein
MLTRLINLRYGNAFSYERAAYSVLNGSMLCGRPGPGLVDKPLQPPVHEPGPPLRDRLLTDPQFGGVGK